LKIQELFRTATLLVIITSIVALNATPTSILYATTMAKEEACFNVDGRTIEITCNISFDKLARGVNDSKLIKNLGRGEYLLSADIHVEDRARLTISSSEVTWLKISNEGGRSRQYNILVNGNIDIVGVKITSWDPDKNSVVEQNSKGSVPRPYIRFQAVRDGLIQDSELAYMGYGSGGERGFSLTDRSANMIINNSDFHHWWYAFYSNDARNITLIGNEYHDNYLYAIDPHSGTRDMNITGNHVYRNAGYGIICSEDCSRILIEGNHVHDNPLGSITLSKNMHHSTVKDNLIYNSDKGINFNASPRNEIYNNTIRNVTVGFYLTQPSGGSVGESVRNVIHNNTVKSAVVGAATNLKADDNIFANNTFLDIKSHEFYIQGGSKMIIENQTFSNYEISGSSGRVVIRYSGTIVVGGDKEEILDTNNASKIFRSNLDDNMTITVNSR
jgi:hypothetical protein